jgi:hypothetical protein
MLIEDSRRDHAAGQDAEHQEMTPAKREARRRSRLARSAAASGEKDGCDLSSAI